LTDGFFSRHAAKLFTQSLPSRAIQLWSVFERITLSADPQEGKSISLQESFVAVRWNQGSEWNIVPLEESPSAYIYGAHERAIPKGIA